METAWKATVTLTNEQVVPFIFETFDALVDWMTVHHGEYTAFIAAKKEGT